MAKTRIIGFEEKMKNVKVEITSEFKKYTKVVDVVNTKNINKALHI
jgi:hypothetical protein